MPRWSYGDNLDPEEERQKLDQARESARAAWDRVEETERLEKEMEEAAREARENRDRYRIGPPPPPGQGCMLPIMVLVLMQVLSVIWVVVR